MTEILIIHKTTDRTLHFSLLKSFSVSGDLSRFIYIVCVSAFCFFITPYKRMDKAKECLVCVRNSNTKCYFAYLTD